MSNYLDNIFGLGGKVAFVTGGNGGLGFNIAKGLAKAGAGICIVGRNKDKNRKAVEEIKADGGNAVSFVADVTKSGDIRHAMAGAIDKLGSLDILVNSAGITMAAPSHQMTETQWADVLGTNLKGVMLCCQEAYRFMKGDPQNPTKIINMIGTYGFFGGAYVAAYSASKGGVVQLTRSLAVEWAQKHIRINAIVPGWFETPMTAPMRLSPDTAKAILRRTPVGRFGKPEETVGAALFLASKASDYITGTCVWVDGGYSISM